jgi:hypothetical protein
VSVVKTIKAALTKNTPFTLVAQTGFTFTPNTNGTLLGGVAPLSKRMVDRILTGEVLVSTPHQAGGSYSERGAGGIYPTVKASAKWQTLEQQLLTDPRGKAGEGAALFAAITAQYGVQKATPTPKS